jgi:hypothetical protein
MLNAIIQKVVMPNVVMCGGWLGEKVLQKRAFWAPKQDVNFDVYLQYIISNASFPQKKLFTPFFI